MAKKPDAAHDTVQAVRWDDGAVVILDQRQLPAREEYLRLRSVAAVIDAIRNMAVRGAPAIGIAAAYGAVLAARECFERRGARRRAELDALLEQLAAARPTAVNLRWAVERMRAAVAGLDADPEPVLLALARRLHQEDVAANRRIGEIGAQLLLAANPAIPARADARPPASPHDRREHASPATAVVEVEGQPPPQAGGIAVLTHCNAGALATGGYGTALGVVRSLFAAGALQRVYATETRPWLQGARLTAWELARDGIPVSVIADSAAGMLLASGKVHAVVVGADRVCANGDVINKIGTYALALLAAAHELPFMVAAPLSTVDPDTPEGGAVPIEERDPNELVRFHGEPLAPATAGVLNPVFDLTPARLLRWLVTERAAVEHPDRGRIRALLDPV